jgi:hypothetical protein
VEQVLPYLEGRMRLEVDPIYVHAFITMMRRRESQVALMVDERAPLPAHVAAVLSGAPSGPITTQGPTQSD